MVTAEDQPHSNPFRPARDLLPCAALPLAHPGGPAVLAIATCREPEEIADAACALLRGEEVTRFGRFRVEHARRDFLAGRAAAKTALGGLVAGTEPLDWEIRRAPMHGPIVVGPDEKLAVTIAHADGVGAAIAHRAGWPCGIDLEARDRPGLEVVESQVTPAEIAWAHAAGEGDAALRRLLLWTAREALGKALGTGLSDPDLLVPTDAWTPIASGWIAQFAGGEFAVRCVVGPKHVVAIVAPTGAMAGAWIERAAGWLQAILSTPEVAS